MQNGFVILGADQLIRVLKAINIVEHVKNTVAWSYGKWHGRDLAENEIITANNIGIDLFLIAKWALLVWFFASAVGGIAAALVVYYLLASNLFTYFYYHAWGSGFRVRPDLESQRRRFLNFVLSIAYYIFCYAYLYQFQFADHIGWPENVVDTTNAVYLSIANAFTLTYGGFQPLSQTARVVFMTELINTFFFFTIIVANALPNLSDKE